MNNCSVCTCNVCIVNMLKIFVRYIIWQWLYGNLQIIMCILGWKEFMTQKPPQHPCMRWESFIYVGSVHILYDTLEGGSSLRSSGHHQGWGWWKCQETHLKSDAIFTADTVVLYTFCLLNSLYIEKLKICVNPHFHENTLNSYYYSNLTNVWFIVFFFYVWVQIVYCKIIFINEYLIQLVTCNVNVNSVTWWII